VVAKEAQQAQDGRSKAKTHEPKRCTKTQRSGGTTAGWPEGTMAWPWGTTTGHGDCHSLTVVAATTVPFSFMPFRFPARFFGFCYELAFKRGSI